MGKNRPQEMVILSTECGHWLRKTSNIADENSIKYYYTTATLGQGQSSTWYPGH